MPKKKRTDSMNFRESVVEEVKTQLRGGLRKVTKGEVIISPQVDILEDADSYIMNFQVPGLTPDALKITVREDELVVEQMKAEEGETKKEGKPNTILEEIEKGRYYRKFRLTGDIQAEGISASLSNGILTLTLSKEDDEDEEKREEKKPAKKGK